ncbi:hypothetical protein F3Y22_tig00111088pilonHSYRG00330 [Hibiscus syriacus]|uniref:Uncharacterized protein n=1 Tax=Hibiscus syriacus TaxID=106335 RepID=A0A6A2Z4J1_HIBSY|nr:hypothetical protein F3Y22_tig00111088pilonHSYRG00330 [Hibiscus syriacus]
MRTDPVILEETEMPMKDLDTPMGDTQTVANIVRSYAVTLVGDNHGGGDSIVNPLANEFDVNLEEGDVVIDCSGLPYRCYTKSLFHVIASEIGNVIKVDYNTNVGERGKFALLAVVTPQIKEGNHQDVKIDEGLQGKSNITRFNGDTNRGGVTKTAKETSLKALKVKKPLNYKPPKKPTLADWLPFKPTMFNNVEGIMLPAMQAAMEKVDGHARVMSHHPKAREGSSNGAEPSGMMPERV